MYGVLGPFIICAPCARDLMDHIWSTLHKRKATRRLGVWVCDIHHLFVTPVSYRQQYIYPTQNPCKMYAQHMLIQAPNEESLVVFVTLAIKIFNALLIGTQKLR